MDTQLRFVYITTKDRAEAKTIGSALVQEKLAACVNIIDGMESLYWWEGNVESDKETILIAKTTDEQIETLTDRVKELHSYDVPCVISLPISDSEGNSDYLNWLRDSVVK